MEPIWSVLQEAMSNGCAILSNNMVGASCYVENWVNWSNIF